MADLTGVTWRKASRTQGADNCVEVGRTTEIVGIRDTKDRDGGTLVVSAETFAAFVSSLSR